MENTAPSIDFSQFSKTALPIIMGLFSQGMMLFFSRLLILHYSEQSYAALGQACPTSSLFSYFFCVLASVNTVFVGYVYGAKRNEETAWPIWQFVYLTLASYSILIPTAFFLPYYLFVDPATAHEATVYFRLMVLMSPLMATNIALSGFFIACEMPSILTYANIAANVVSISVIYLLLHGVGSWHPDMGLLGAGIGILCGELVILMIYTRRFFSARYRQKYATLDARLRPHLLLKYLRTALPQALASLSDYAAWTVAFLLLARLNMTYLVVTNLMLMVFELFAYFSEGLSQTTAAQSAVLIGKERNPPILKIVRYAGIYLVAFGVLVSLLLLLYPEQTLAHILPNNIQDAAYYLFFSMCEYLMIFIMMDGISTILSGVLSASQQTTFTMITITLCTWGLAALPTYVFVYQLKWGGLPTYWMFNMLYVGTVITVFVLKIRTQPWKKLAPST